MSAKPDPADTTLAAALQQRIADGQGAAAFAELYATFQRDGAHSYETIRATMALLERLWEISPPTAAYLMARLEAPAGSKYAHDVRDGIWLFLESGDLAVAAALTRLAGEGIRRQQVKALLAIAARIEQRSR